jgi:hypothetical protein
MDLNDSLLDNITSYMLEDWGCLYLYLTNQYLKHLYIYSKCYLEFLIHQYQEINQLTLRY